MAGEGGTSQARGLESTSEPLVSQSRCLWAAPVMIQDLSRLMTRLCPKLSGMVGLAEPLGFDLEEANI